MRRERRGRYRDPMPRLRVPSPQVSDALIAIALLLLLVLSFGKTPEVGQHPEGVLAYLLALGLCLPYALHRRYPEAVLGVTVASLIAYSLGSYTAFPGVSVFALLFALALHTSRRRSLIALIVVLAAFVIALLVQPTHVVDGTTWTSTLLACAVAWLAGENQRNRRARWAAMEERAERLEQDREQQARDAVAAERLRIARELHDVVAHSMSVIAVQSGVGNHVIDTQPEEARRALRTIEITSRAALTEMRRLLDVLRQDDEPLASLTPAPGLCNLPTLIDQVRTTGLPVNLAIEGEAADVPPGVDLSAYRIIQEALTNVLKHGGGTAVVRVRYRESEVDLEVVDDGHRAAHERGASVPAPSAPAGPGHGIIGMRERVALFGGVLSVSPRPGGGFRVAASLPYTTGPS